MKKILSLSCIFLIFNFLCYAGIVDVDKAAIIAKNQYWQQASQLSYENLVLSLIYTQEQDGLPVYYIFNSNDNMGFVIVAAEDNVYPILGYSVSLNFPDKKNQLPPNYKSWMDNYTEQIMYVRQNDLQADDDIKKSWNKLSTTQVQSKEPKNVVPLLSTTWDQGCYYNGLSPIDAAGPCGRCWAGCVATAMAQVMKYYNYPEQGSGSHSYYHATYGTQSANFGATTYNWAGMPNNISSANSAIATLLYHCGVSVDMGFGPGGSGAYSSEVPYALINYFNYKNTAVYLYKTNYTNTNWENLIKADLDASKPVYYAGSGTAGGHAFVCDGYQGTNYFHFNWGWSGAYNGYFYLTNLNPGTANFTDNQRAITGIYPDNPTLSPPTNLQAQVVNENDVNLTWVEPVSGPSEWIRWDNNDNTGGVGYYTNGGSFYTASRWLPAELAAYDDLFLSKISLYVHEDPNATISLRVWKGANAATLLVNQSVPGYVVDSWNEFTLNTPVQIDASQELWFGYYISHEAGYYPAGADGGPAIQFKGDMFSNDASSWISISNEWSIDRNWSLAAWVSPTADGKSVAVPLVKEVAESNSGLGELAESYSNNEIKKYEIAYGDPSAKALIGYNIYRNNSFLAYTTQTSYSDLDLSPDNYNYCVKAVYDEGESICSNSVDIEIIDPNYLEPPTSLNATLNQNNGEVLLDWHYGSSGFYEDFDDGIADNWTLSDSRLFVNSGYLKMDGLSNNTWASSYYDEVFEDFTFEYEVQRQTGDNTLGNSLGAILRTDGLWATGSDNGYLINITASGYYGAWIHINGSSTNIVPWTVSSYINTGLGVANIVTIDVSGPLFSIYINGNFAFSFSDNTFSSGKVGVGTYDAEDGVNSVWWNYVSLTTTSDNMNFPPKTAINPLALKTAEGLSNQCLGPNISNSSIPVTGFLSDPSIVKSNFLYFNVYRNSSLIGTSTEQNYTDILTEYGTFDYYITAYYSEGESEASNTEIVEYLDLSPTLDLKVYIEGPFTGSHLTTSLNVREFIPLSQPYNGPPWNYSGLESVGSIPNDEVVDWILVELRDAPVAEAATEATTVFQQAAFLLSDGSVVDLDGQSKLEYPGAVNYELFAVIRHRNHIDIMSENPVSGAKGIYNYDFTTSADQAYNSVQKDLGGVFGMYGGDGVADGEIASNDKVLDWDLDAGKCGYLMGDFSLNAEVQNSDKNNIWLENFGIVSSIPVTTPFSCGDYFIDPRDGQIYGSVLMQSYCWMSENINIGLMIPKTTSQTNNGTVEKYCYDNDLSNCGSYGGLYNWSEMMNYVTTEGTQGICPDGWHIPGYPEYSALYSYLGTSTPGGKMKETGFDHWLSPNTGATNTSGFTALPGGEKDSSGNFDEIGETGFIWLSYRDASYNEKGIAMKYDDAHLFTYTYYQLPSISVRCVKD